MRRGTSSSTTPTLRSTAGGWTSPAVETPGRRDATRMIWPVSSHKELEWWGKGQNGVSARKNRGGGVVGGGDGVGRLMRGPVFFSRNEGGGGGPPNKKTRFFIPCPPFPVFNMWVALTRGAVSGRCVCMCVWGGWLNQNSLFFDRGFPASKKRGKKTRFLSFPLFGCIMGGSVKNCTDTHVVSLV